MKNALFRSDFKVLLYLFSLQKSHTCEEGGIQIIIKKLLKWANKKQNNFNIYNAAFF